MRSRGNSGFTLIELVVTIAIVGILLAIAVPTYYAQIRHSRRSDAITALGALTLLEEGFRATHPTYGDSTNNATTGLLSSYPSAPLSITHYNIAISFVGSNDGTNYVLTATARVGDDQNNDHSEGASCSPLVLQVVNNTRTKTPTSCWK